MKKFYLAILAVVAFVFASCSKDEVKLDNNNSLSFNFTVNGTPSLNDGTKAVKTAWEDGDCVFIALNQDNDLLAAGKYIKLTYNATTGKWNTTLEGVDAANKLTEEEIITYAGTDGKQVCAFYIQGATELCFYNSKLAWGANELQTIGQRTITSYSIEYFSKSALPLIIESPYSGADMAKLTVTDNVASATLKINNPYVTQVAVTGLTKGNNWYLFRICTNAVFVYESGLSNFGSKGYEKGTLSSDATEASNYQYDFFVPNSITTGSIKIVNYDTGILYTKAIGKEIEKGKAYRIAGPTDFTTTSGDAGNGWTAETITITPL